MKIKYLVLICIVGAITASDQATKMLIVTKYQLGESTTVIENFFNITYVRNFGAAFGMLANMAPDFRDWFFLSLPPIAMIIIVVLLRGVPPTDRVQTIALSLVFGGALGNYLDRLRFGFVVDFLDFHYKNAYVWPAFNVADMSIVSGVSLLFWQMMFTKKEPQDHQPE